MKELEKADAVHSKQCNHKKKEKDEKKSAGKRDPTLVTSTLDISLLYRYIQMVQWVPIVLSPL